MVCAGFDPHLDAAVLRQATALREAGLRIAVSRHPPHLTLGAVTVATPDLEQVRALVAGLAQRQRPFGVRLDHFGAFPGGVLWLGPQPSAALSALQFAVDGGLQEAGHARAFGAQSDPAQWVAHCTLARRLAPNALGRAVALVAEGFRPAAGRVERLLIIRLGSGAAAEVLPLHR